MIVPGEWFAELQHCRLCITFEKRPRMFIVVYREGSQHHDALEKETWAQANALATPKYIFSWDGPQGGYELYKTPGIQHYGSEGSLCHFQHDKYTLTHVKKRIHGNSSNWQKEFDFIFRFDKVKDIVIKEITTEEDFPRALSNAIKEIIRAGKFDSWEEYQQSKRYTKELDRLKRENETLQKEVEVLKQKIATENTPA